MRIKKLNTFEKLTVLAETKLDTLKVTAETLIEDDHYASEEIREIMDSLQTRYVFFRFLWGLFTDSVRVFSFFCGDSLQTRYVFFRFFVGTLYKLGT